MIVMKKIATSADAMPRVKACPMNQTAQIASELADKAAARYVREFQTEQGHLVWRKLSDDLRRVARAESRVFNAIKDLWCLSKD